MHRTYLDPRATPIDVRYCWHRRVWVANGPEGDYGISSSRDKVIACAIDAAVTGGAPVGDTFRKIHVYDRDHVRCFTIVRVKSAQPSPQFFQDAIE